MSGTTLDDYLTSSVSQKEGGAEVAAIVKHLSTAALKVSALINQGALGAAFAGTRGGTNVDGDVQKDLDVVADDTFLGELRDTPLALYGSEELDNAVLVNPESSLALAIDPLDGSSNIDTNVSIGTIFSILPVDGDPKTEPSKTFSQPGNKQLAAGFFIYGPQLALALTVGDGTQIFVFSERLGGFIQAYDSVSISPRASEFAINASNYRHWEEETRQYIDDCLSGSEGPRERDFNMRWIASLVTEAYRILIRGGIFLYPGDKRKGYQHGRLRLVYEANPIAMLIEQAGGGATNGHQRILDIVPDNLHQRVPFVFGSKKEVVRVGRYHDDPNMIGERSPLFGNRGLFRA